MKTDTDIHQEYKSIRNTDATRKCDVTMNLLRIV